MHWSGFPIGSRLSNTWTAQPLASLYSQVRGVGKLCTRISEEKLVWTLRRFADLLVPISSNLSDYLEQNRCSNVQCWCAENSLVPKQHRHLSFELIFASKIRQRVGVGS